jgi:predicted transcriptional regulator
MPVHARFDPLRSFAQKPKAEIMDDKAEIIEMTADIVAAYVENNTIATSDLPALIQSVHRSLTSVAAGVEAVEAPPKEPAVPVRRSITPDHLICLEDGRKFKSLKRHLRTKYNMSPEDYRAKWGLAKDYPMVAPNYAKARSELAKQMGLGQGGRQAAKPKRR